LEQTFDCPKCGGPLSFEPKPGEETIECPYCHETVIIPKDLRVRPPRPVVHREPPPEPSEHPNRLVIAIVGIVLAIVCLGIIFVTNLSNQSSADLPTDTPFFDEFSATSTASSAVDSATATIEAQATLDALQPLLTEEKSWPSSFVDVFADNSHKWQTGDVRDSYISGTRSISGGKYTWNVTAVQSASDYSLPDMPSQKDFFASVDMNLVKMPDDSDADAGLVFRYNAADQTWYYFSVNNQGQYYFGWYDGTDWYNLIPETDSAAIFIGQTNRLTVAAKGSQFIFLINGQMVDHFIDDNLKSGTIGVGLNLPQTGEKAVVEFANFSVSSSPGL
jgi:hypothetical protein